MEEETSLNISWKKNPEETCLRELCLELALEGNFSPRFQALWVEQPVVLGGEELNVLCRVAAKGVEMTHNLNGRWHGFH